MGKETGTVIQIKLFSSYYLTDLEANVNEFLKQHSITGIGDLIDIKLRTFGDPSNWKTIMVVYKE